MRLGAIKADSVKQNITGNMRISKERMLPAFAAFLEEFCEHDDSSATIIPFLYREFLEQFFRSDAYNESDWIRRNMFTALLAQAGFPLECVGGEFAVLGIKPVKVCRICGESHSLSLMPSHYGDEALASELVRAADAYDQCDAMCNALREQTASERPSNQPYLVN
jgi:hypothetical protein